MDEYIEQLQNSITPTPLSTEKKSNRYKEILSIISTSKPDIKIIEYSDVGDVKFEVSNKSLNLTYEMLIKYKRELMSDFITSTLGELIIREHIDKFVKLMMEGKDKYQYAVNKFMHRKFGLKIFSTKMVFAFHASLLQNILTEDFRKQI